MRDGDSNLKSSSSRLAYVTLKRIADLLGVPVEALLDEGPPADYGDAAQLIQLWHRIESSEDRQFVLDLLRKLTKDDDNPRTLQHRRDKSVAAVDGQSNRTALHPLKYKWA